MAVYRRHWVVVVVFFFVAAAVVAVVIAILPSDNDDFVSHSQFSFTLVHACIGWRGGCSGRPYIHSQLQTNCNISILQWQVYNLVEHECWRHNRDAIKRVITLRRTRSPTLVQKLQKERERENED